MDGDDLSLMVTTCPGLQALDISCTLKHGVSLAPLQQLSVLTSLRAGPLDLEGATPSQPVAGQLAALTALSTLDILDKHFDDLQLMQLSTLTRLTHLRRCGFRHTFTFSTCDITLHNQVCEQHPCHDGCWPLAASKSFKWS